MARSILKGHFAWVKSGNLRGSDDLGRHLTPGTTVVVVVVVFVGSHEEGGASWLLVWWWSEQGRKIKGGRRVERRRVKSDGNGNEKMQREEKWVN